MKSKRSYYLIYTLLFLVISFAAFFPFIIMGKSFIFSGADGGGDGISQHYTALAYYGRYLRRIFGTLVTQHKLSIPMWDMSIGYGADIITTLNYYVLGDPFALLAILCPIEQTEILYNILILLRLYCAGAAFSAYCFTMKRSVYSTLIGALIYTFCGYSLLAPLLHPYFANPMVWFPVILVGVEKILNNQKSGAVIYVIALALSALSNYYFLYMICIMVAVYTVFRYFMVIREKRVRVLMSWVGRLLVYSIWAICIAMILLLPAIMSSIHTNRIGVQRIIPILYPAVYYKEFLSSFITGKINGYYSYMGYAPVAVCAILLLFQKRKIQKLWKIYFLCLTAMLLIPYAGSIMNGLTYVTNRWIWAYSFLVSFFAVLGLPKLMEMNKTEKIRLAAGCFIWSILIIGLEYFSFGGRQKVALILLLLTAVLFIFYKKKWDKIVKICILGSVVANVTANAWFSYLPRYGNRIVDYQNAGTAWKAAAKEAPNSLVKELFGADESRYDTAAIGANVLQRNSAMLNQLNGTSLYFSTMNGKTSKFQEEMYLNFPMEHSFENLDGRSLLTTLFSVKYEVIPKEASAYLPYGYDAMITDGDTYAVYENRKAVPMIYWYGGVIPRDSYNEMTVTQKQQAILQGAVIEADRKELWKIEEIIPQFYDREMLYHVTIGGGAKFGGGEDHI